MPGVVLSHGGIQYSYQIALALQEMGALERFFTTFCYSPAHWLGRMIGAMPSRMTDPFRSYLQRRTPVGIREDMIEVFALPEVLRRAGTALLGGGRGAVNRMIHRQNRMFDRYVARRLDGVSCEAVIALSGSALVQCFTLMLTYPGQLWRGSL